MDIRSLLLLMLDCESRPERGWFILKWIDQPRTPASEQASVDDASRTKFDLVQGYTVGEDDFTSIKPHLREGDLIAYRMKRTESALSIAKGELNTVGYQILGYGHLAILVKTPQSDALVLFSSQSFKGPNVDEGIDTLETHSFDVYRLDQWERVNHARLYEFVDLAREKAGKWYGYDFSGMFGLWNSNLKPATPSDIGHDYICSTIVLACLYYAGVELDAAKRNGILDIVSPKQVCDSEGRIIAAPDVTIEVAAYPAH